MTDGILNQTSLCMVGEKDNSGQIKLMRLADVSDGRLAAFVVNEEAPKYFENRSILYWRNGPEIAGMIGVWNWTAKPNYTNTEKDFVDTLFMPDIEPIEVITVQEAKTIEELIVSLRLGIAVRVTGRRVLFSCLTELSAYLGLLCGAKEIEYKDETVVLKNNVITLPLYEFSEGEICRSKGKAFYHLLEIGKPNDYIALRAPVEIVREQILQRASWSVMKLRGMSRSQWKQVKEFLAEIPDKPLYQEIAENCNCSEAEAREHVVKFTSNANCYIEQEDIERCVLEEIIENHTGLMERCAALAASQWEEVHQEKVLAAKNELFALEEEMEQKKERLAHLTSQVEESLSRCEALNAEMSELETLGETVKKNVANRIENVKDNAANLISELIFLTPMLSQVTDKGYEPKSEETVFIKGMDLDEKDLEVNEDWNDLIGTLESELLEAGVAEQYLSGLAAFMYASYLNHASLLLAGPCGLSIANAFSAALFGKKADVLDCSGGYSSVGLVNMIQSDDEITVIQNPFQTSWIEHVPELLMRQKKYFFIVCPFAEDLVIEPRGLYNYMLPIFTEAFVDKIPSCDFIGGYMGDGFKHFERETVKTAYSRLLRSMNMSRLGIGRLQSVLSDAQDILQTGSKDIDFLFGLFPYAYVTGQKQLLIDKICDEQSVSGEVRTYILTFLGEEV